MDTESNPYASPASDDRSTHELQETPNGVVDFVPIMRRWERLWFFYNGALIPLVLFLSFVAVPQHATDIDYWLSVCLGGIIANLCFLIGPTIEAYGTRFRIWNRTLTVLLFLAGLGFTGLLALLCIASYTAI